MAFLDDFPVDIPIDEHLLSLESTMRNAWNFRSRSENVHAAFSERGGRSGTASRRVGPDAMDDLEANAQVMFETLSGELGAGGPSGPNGGQLVPTAANNRVWGAERPAEEGIVEPKAALGTSAIGTTTTWIFVGAVAVVVIMMYTFSAGGKRKALRK